MEFSLGNLKTRLQQFHPKKKPSAAERRRKRGEEEEEDALPELVSRGDVVTVGVVVPRSARH